ncbi:MAG: aminotransferase class IV [Bacteroidales bacterium]|nr:aminotransferase class IV [Bacteroidales bacterium]
MGECISKYFLLNDEILEDVHFTDDWLKGERILYDVMRVIRGIPLFWDDHYERLRNSSALSGLPLQYSNLEIYRKLIQLIERNNILEGNLKMLFSQEDNNGKQNLIAYFVAHKYPLPSEYNSGVRTITLRAERKNPNVKLVNKSLRDRCNQLIAEEGVYEVLLVDHENNITEGSRSNVFFICQNEIITPPVSDVLPGITRAYILKICAELKMKIVARKVGLDEIDQFDGIFISGTSPKVLPVVAVNDYTFSFESILLKRIMQAFDRMIEEYIVQHKQANKEKV